jgi:hypothetical protein
LAIDRAEVEAQTAEAEAVAEEVSGVEHPVEEAEEDLVSEEARLLEEEVDQGHIKAMTKEECTREHQSTTVEIDNQASMVPQLVEDLEEVI